MQIPSRGSLLVASLSILAPLAASTFLSRAPSARAAAQSAPLVRPRPNGASSLRSRPAEPQPSPERTKFLRRLLPRVGGDVVFRKVARELGVTEWRGKRLDVSSNSADGQLLALDQPVDVTPGSQNEPSIAVNPNDESRIVVFAHNDDNFSGYDNACSIYLSFDAGFSFFYAQDALLLNPTDTCAYPVVRYSPDGNVVYYSYLSISDDASRSDVMVAVGDGDDPTTIVSGPNIVFTGAFGDFNDKPWIDVHTFDSADGVSDGAAFVYATTTIFYVDGHCGVVFNRSINYGASWVGVGGMGSLDYSLDCNLGFTHGPRAAAGPGQQVLVCYFDAGADGFSAPLDPPALLNRFDISCRSSADRGANFGVPFAAARNVAFELNYSLGPNELYHRWLGGMFPALTIDHNGTAHLVFAMDPTASKVDAEAGNVQYVRSTASAGNPPYTTWTPRVTIGSGLRAQGYPTIAAQRSLLTTNSYIYIAYYDHYRSPTAAPNVLYDVRYRKSLNGGATFGAPVTVTDVPSLSDVSFIGDYFDSAATMRKYFLVWTDRADKTNVFDAEDDIVIDRY
jgi:hypothetical protein